MYWQKRLNKPNKDIEIEKENTKHKKRQSKLWLQKNNSHIKKIRTNNKQKESTKISSKVKTSSKKLFTKI